MMNIKNTFYFILLVSVLSVMLAIPALAAKIGVPQNVRWEEATACWDEVEDTYQYEVQLYKDGVKTNSVLTTTVNSIELSSNMTEKGKYTFRVRVRERISDDYGRYSESSGTYVQEKTVTVKSRRTTTSTTPAKEASERGLGPGVVGKNWRQDAKGWWYDNGEGSYLSGGWYQLNEKWYYFNTSGYLQTGWITVDGVQYYTLSDGSRVTGWTEIDGGYYYFNESGVYTP